jgi:DNA-binding MarR family transcriptional regulator
MVETGSPANPPISDDDVLRHGIELMFYAYRDFTYESDQQLKHYRLGRAHHRALYFIGRHPGQTVGHLLSILKLTKQSISRVLKDLIEEGYVEQKSAAHDRRNRPLWLTEKGENLERELIDRQSRRFARAYREAGADAVEGFHKVLLGLLDQVERLKIDKWMRGDARGAPSTSTLGPHPSPHSL